MWKLSSQRWHQVSAEFGLAGSFVDFRGGALVMQGRVKEIWLLRHLDSCCLRTNFPERAPVPCSSYNLNLPSCGPRRLGLRPTCTEKEQIGFVHKSPVQQIRPEDLPDCKALRPKPMSSRLNMCYRLTRLTHVSWTNDPGAKNVYPGSRWQGAKLRGVFIAGIAVPRLQHTAATVGLRRMLVPCPAKDSQ